MVWMASKSAIFVYTGQGVTAGLSSHSPVWGLIYVFNGILLRSLLQYVFIMLIFITIGDKIYTLKQEETAGLPTFPKLCGLIHFYNSIFFSFLSQCIFFMLLFGLLVSYMCTVEPGETAGLSTYPLPH